MKKEYCNSKMIQLNYTLVIYAHTLIHGLQTIFEAKVTL